MSDAAKIISKLLARYRCPRADCEGTVAMTLGRVDGETEFLYRCDSCRHGWGQDGKPLHMVNEGGDDE